MIAENRTGPENFVTCMREALGKKFGTEVVAVGGAFLVDKGSAWIHVMPDFPKEPFESLEAVDK